VIVVVALAGAALLAVVVFDVFDGGGEEQPIAGSRYCELARELDRVSRSTGAASSAGVYSGPPANARSAVDEMGGTLEELRSLAPKPVRADVVAVTDALRRAGSGDANAMSDPEVTAAAERVSRHRTASCSTGSGVSDGD
jgi:hypothetical protein